MTGIRPRRAIWVAVAALALLSTTAMRCGDERPAPQVPPAPTMAAATPHTLAGVALRDPTDLRLFLPWGWYADVDAATRRAVDATTWLDRPGAAPLLINEVRRQDVEFGPVRIQPPRAEPGLPGAPRIVRLTSPALATLAASVDAGGVWVEEYASRDRCTLREVGLDGRDRRAPRAVPCGTRPMAETRYGLWVRVGPDAFDAAQGAGLSEQRVALLDPATLRERVRFPAVHLVDDHRVVVASDEFADTLRLHDLRTGRASTFTLPTKVRQPTVWPVSPDRRYLPFTFESPGTSPQVMDLWLLDLRTMGWLHVPSMPVYTALKATSLAWAADGRLVLLGDFDKLGPTLVTWWPGDAQLALRPYARPSQRPDQPSTDLFLVL